MGTPTGGLPDRPVLYEPRGWSGNIAMTTTLPNGEVAESGVDALSFNSGLVGQGFEEPGIFRLTLDDGTCRQEFDVEVVLPSD